MVPAMFLVVMAAVCVEATAVGIGWEADGQDAENEREKCPAHTAGY